MSTVAGKQLKINKSIVIDNSVDVMDYFARFQIATKFFFHDQTRAQNVFFVVSIRMFARQNHYSAFSTFMLPPFPIRRLGAVMMYAIHGIITSLMSITHFLFSFFGMFSAFDGFTDISFVFLGKTFAFQCLTDFSFCFFRMFMIFLKRHSKLQIKKAAFSELKRTQQSVQRLLTTLDSLGNTIFPLAIGSVTNNTRMSI